MYRLVAFLLIAFSLPLQASERVYLFAAASLTTALTELTQQYEARTGVRVITNYAASSALARQIYQGAPADLYLSANQRWMDYLAGQAQLEPGYQGPLLRNRLVLIAPADNSKPTPQALTATWPLAQQLGDGRLAIADPDHVPAGIYSKEALESLTLWPRVRRQLARANNVRGALALVERGESPLGLVYSTDARQSDAVSVVATIAPEHHSAIEYPLAMVKGHNRPAVLELYNYLHSDAARQIFINHGFIPARAD